MVRRLDFHLRAIHIPPATNSSVSNNIADVLSARLLSESLHSHSAYVLFETTSILRKAPSAQVRRRQSAQIPSPYPNRERACARRGNFLAPHSYQTTCHSWIGASRPLTCTAPIGVASPNLSLTACQTGSEINN